MSHAEKSAAYQELKAAGVKFDKTYQQYSTEELVAAVNTLRGPQLIQPIEEPWANSVTPEQLFDGGLTPEQQAYIDAFDQQFADSGLAPQPAPQETIVTQREIDTAAGMGQNRPEDDVRVDEQGLIWYQDEIRKPAMARPRLRRVIRYIDSGVKEQTIQSGQYLETFEVAGDEKRQAEAKITMPNYQVGIYKDPRYPFKIHVYNEQRGFDLFEVGDYYGGQDLVPEEIKRVYVMNSLTYDIRTTVRAIETEYRQLQLQQSRENRA